MYMFKYYRYTFQLERCIPGDSDTCTLDSLKSANTEGSAAGRFNTVLVYPHYHLPIPTSNIWKTRLRFLPSIPQQARLFYDMNCNRLF